MPATQTEVVNRKTITKPNKRNKEPDNGSGSDASVILSKSNKADELRKLLVIKMYFKRYLFNFTYIKLFCRKLEKISMQTKAFLLRRKLPRNQNLPKVGTKMTYK